MGASRVVEQPLHAVVLVVVPGVVLGLHFRVAEWDLPEDEALLGDRGEGLEEAGVAGEVGGAEPRGAAITVDRLLEASVTVAELGEGDVEISAEGGVEIAGAGSEGVGGGVVGLAVLDVDPRPPDTQVVAKEDVGGVLVTELDDRLRHPGGGVWEARDIGHAGTSDLGEDGTGVIARGSLLQVPPHIRFDLEDNLVGGEGSSLLEEELQVVVVGVHGGRVLEVGVDRARFAGGGAGRGLEDLVVREDGDEPVGDRILNVVFGEIAVGVPVGPAVAGVDAPREVLVAEAIWSGGLEGGRAAGAIAGAELEGGRPASGQQASGLGARRAFA